MFRKQMIMGVFFWIFSLFFYIQTFYYPSPTALQAYQNLMQLKHTHHKNNPLAKQRKNIQQEREQIRKQFFFMQDNQRVQFRLSSDHSDLIFNQEGKTQEVTEYFQNLACLMQEKLIDVSDLGEKLKKGEGAPKNSQPKQYLCHLQAEKGAYAYQSGELKANQVQFIRYLLPGHSWPAVSENDLPLLRGEAREMQGMLYKNKQPGFKAQGFYMTLEKDSAW